MVHQAYVLDSSGIIGGFLSKKLPNFITSQVILEIKDLKSQIFLEDALEKGRITIEEPLTEDINKINRVITESGDILRLSEVDIQVVALALTLKRNDISPTVVTDDYSIQNVLKIMEIPFRSVLTNGIVDVVGWIKFCKGCRKIYPSDYTLSECEICGSPISRKRTKK
jgi:endoribonuclease Nob1